MDFLDTGYIPKGFPERTWACDFVFIRNGYTKQDIELMESDEYDVMLEYLLEKSRKSPPKSPFEGGI